MAILPLPLAWTILSLPAVALALIVIVALFGPVVTATLAWVADAAVIWIEAAPDAAADPVSPVTVVNALASPPVDPPIGCQAVPS
jgi:hypothetical protein